MASGERSYTAHTSIILLVGIHLAFYSAFFVVPLFGSATAAKFATLLLYLSIFIIGLSFVGNRISLTAENSKFLIITTAAFGFMLVFGFFNSIVRFGIKNALINSSMVLGVFLYFLAVLSRPEKVIHKVQNVFSSYALISAFLSILQYYWYAYLPLVGGYVQFKISKTELSNLATDIFNHDTGMLKPFGLFQDHLANGFVLSVAAVFITSKLLFDAKSGKTMSSKLFKLIAITILGWVVFLTDSRNSMLVFIIGLLAVFAFKSRSFRISSINHPILINLLPLILYLSLMAAAVVHTATSGEFDSIAARVFTWAVVYTRYIIHGGLSGILFGYGVTPFRDEQSDPDLWALDNTIVQAYMLCGLVGVIVFMGWWFWISARLLKMAAFCGDAKLIAIYVLSVQYLVIGAFNATLFAVPITPVFLVLAYLGFVQKKKRIL